MGDVLGRKADAFVQFKQQLLNNDSTNEQKNSLKQTNNNKNKLNENMVFWISYTTE